MNLRINFSNISEKEKNKFNNTDIISQNVTKSSTNCNFLLLKVLTSMSEFEIMVLFYGSLAGSATLLGIILMRKKQEWAIKRSQYVNSFAAGLILALAFFHLIPEAAELSEMAFPVIFIGFFLFYTMGQPKGV